MRPALLLLFSLSTALAQKLEVTPARVMVDESATILASGLEPSERVTISAELTDGSDAHWIAQADFVADAQGNVDTSKQAPVAGSYKEISAMGLVWSMKPQGHNAGRYVAPRNLADQSIEFHLARKNKKIASARLDQSSMLPGERRIVVHEGPLRGALFLPPGNERHPGVLVLGGSEGGLSMGRRAAWLASHGYAALALAYFRYEDLPQLLEAIPLEYFGQALSWMAKRPEIIPERIAIMGVSRGGELTLQLGSTYQGIKALVAYVPADTRHGACCGSTRVAYAWTLNGQPLAYTSGRRSDLDAEMRAAIQVERMKGAIMMISGGSDGIWSSSSMTNAVVDRLKRAHFAYEIEHLNYPMAGHTAGRPEIVPAWQGEARNPTSGRGVNAGGTVEGNAASSLDAIPKVLDFLQRTLQP